MRDKNENNKNNENRPEEELILGRNPVIEALKADKLIDMIFVNPDAKGSISLILKLARERDIPVKQVREQKLDLMAHGASHQGVIAIGACAEYVEVDDILKIAADKDEDPFIIICDEIASAEDARAVEEATSSGIRIVASFHGDTVASVRSSPFAERLIDKNVFGIFAGISRDGDGRYSVELTARDGSAAP